MKPKVIVVVGPTAVGKSKMALKLAEHYHIDIISGDSIAVYRGQDIGSAKPSPLEQSLVKHHLIDILDAGMPYSVYDFQKVARPLIESNNLSLICGGTGLYIQAAIFNYEFEAAQRSLEFAKQFNDFSNEQLYLLLETKDPNFDRQKIHPNNRKRVLRALEVLEDTGKSIAQFSKAKEALYDYFVIYLDMDRDKLYKRIDERVDQMLADGLLAEVKKFYDQSIPIKGIGYVELYDYFAGKTTLEEAIADIKKNSRHLAKRQRTWFFNQLDSHFYQADIDFISLVEKVEKDIDEWLKI